ncbi:MAG: M48 family metallopeptidase [Pseudomonadales bacterium]
MPKLLFGVLLSFLAASMAFAADFDPVAATNAYLSSVSAAEKTNTNDYVDAGYRIMMMAVVLEVLVAFVLLHFGWSRKWRDLAERITANKFAQAFIYAPIYLVVTTLLMFPLSWYAEFYTEHKYGLATQGFGAWLVELLQMNAFMVIGLSLFIALFYLILRLSPERWWLWASGLVVSFFLVLMFISPLYIEPVFNDYRPMDEGELKERILSIARANGMQADDVKQVDQSRQTNRVSANVSGIFGSTRIALNDNLLKRADPDAVEAVMAHEIGHYVLNHLWKTMAYFALIFLLGFALTNAAFSAVARRRASWGIRGIDDYAGFPLLYAIGMVLLFLATPLFYKLTYIHEAEADLFAINATQNPDAWAEVALLTAEYRKLRPPQWEENWLNHHPSPYARIHMAMRWKAEQ